jgi:hypothetical protein
MDGLIPGLGIPTKEKTIAKASKSRIEEPILCKGQNRLSLRANFEVAFKFIQKSSSMSTNEHKRRDRNFYRIYSVVQSTG